MSVTATPPKRHDQDELDVLVDKRRALRVEVGELEARLRALKRIDEVDAADAKLTGLRQEIRELEEQAPTILATAQRDADAVRGQAHLDGEAHLEAKKLEAAEILDRATRQGQEIVEQRRNQAQRDSENIVKHATQLESQAQATLRQAQQLSKAFADEARASVERLAEILRKGV